VTDHLAIVNSMWRSSTCNVCFLSDYLELL